MVGILKEGKKTLMNYDSEGMLNKLGDILKDLGRLTVLMYNPVTGKFKSILKLVLLKVG